MRKKNLPQNIQKWYQNTGQIYKNYFLLIFMVKLKQKYKKIFLDFDKVNKKPIYTRLVINIVKVNKIQFYAVKTGK